MLNPAFFLGAQDIGICGVGTTSESFHKSHWHWLLTSFLVDNITWAVTALCWRPSFSLSDSSMDSWKLSPSFPGLRPMRLFPLLTLFWILSFKSVVKGAVWWVLCILASLHTWGGLRNLWYTYNWAQPRLSLLSEKNHKTTKHESCEPCFLELRWGHLGAPLARHC